MTPSCIDLHLLLTTHTAVPGLEVDRVLDLFSSVTTNSMVEKCVLLPWCVQCATAPDCSTTSVTSSEEPQGCNAQQSEWHCKVGPWYNRAHSCVSDSLPILKAILFVSMAMEKSKSAWSKTWNCHCIVVRNILLPLTHCVYILILSHLTNQSRHNCVKFFLLEKYVAQHNERHYCTLQVFRAPSPISCVVWGNRGDNQALKSAKISSARFLSSFPSTLYNKHPFHTGILPIS